MSVLAFVYCVHAAYMLGVVYASGAVTPTISSISGTVATGQTLTITGSGLENENSTNWDPFFTTNPNAYNFKGASPVVDGYCTSGNCQGNYDTTVKLLGAQSIHWNVNANGVIGNSCPGANLYGYNGILRNTGGAADNLWVRWYGRWHAANNDWPYVNVKMYYGFSSNINQPGVYYEPYTQNAGASPTTMLMKVGGFDVRPSLPNPPDTSGHIDNDRWYLFELNQNSLVSPPTVSIWMDNQQILNNYAPEPAGTVLADWFILFGMINVCGYDAALNLDHWWDGFAFGSSRIYPASLVEISNNSTYGQGTVLYQVPVYISDGSIQITVNIAGLGTGPYYLWVTNNSQQRSQPFSMTGGLVPSPPAGLSVH